MMLAYSHTEDVEVMISEICRCSLLDVFKANGISNSQIPKRTQVVYAQQLAQGMNHLHKSRPPIIHRDLKPANLLIDFSGTLKIADFGLAKIRPNPERTESEAFLMTGETGSYRFMAPEVFRHEEYTETVDVYSYAMIFYYMLRSTPPWAGLSGLDAVTKAAVDGERPLIPRNVDERLVILLKRCWDEDPRARPSFEHIITSLNIYSHDVFKTDDKEVQRPAGHPVDGRCKPGCAIM
jgi:serine/threonine protein kinase